MGHGPQLLPVAPSRACVCVCVCVCVRESTVKAVYRLFYSRPCRGWPWTATAVGGLVNMGCVLARFYAMHSSWCLADDIARQGVTGV